ncbi:circadian clock-controlled protein daywake-like [Prorops nasuta]|uniref:circadian clock-controlled protein daywake-like n=1 Tax=Prorops nasuta TaxID=863751 RepID=UPI0034CF907E
MSFLKLAVICAFIVAVFGDPEVDFPMKACHRGSDDYSSCLRLAIQESWPTFVKGVPELDVPVLDPFFVKEEETRYNSESLQGKIVAKNVRTYGLAKAKFLSVRPEFTDDFYRLQVDVDLPKLLVEGDYKAEGQLGDFKMGGKGSFNISMEDIHSTWDISGHVKNDRWVIEHFRAVPEITTMKVWFNGLFDGNDELNAAAMAFVNEYWPVVYRQMLPHIQDTWDKELTEFANRIFSKISFSKTFP